METPKKNKTNSKEYNANYYKLNKDTNKLKLLKQTKCSICGRSVTHQNIVKHQTYAICKNNAIIEPNLFKLEDLMMNDKYLVEAFIKFINDKLTFDPNTN